MAWNATQLGAVMVHAAPLLGIPLWLVAMRLPSNSWNFPLMFASGLFMLGFGLAIPIAVWFGAAHPALKAEALSALYFHGVIAILGALLCIAFVIAIQFDPPNPTMSNPPVHGEGILVIGA